MLLDGDLDLRSAQSGRLHALGLGKLRSCLAVNFQVVVTHEVDGQTGLNAKFGLLHCELLKPENRHCLEEDFLRPDCLNSGGKGVSRIVAGDACAAVYDARSNITACWGWECHIVIYPS